MKRREFIKDSSVLAFSIGAFGTIQWNGRSFIGDSPTTSDILGPFYRPNAPLRDNLLTDKATGEILDLRGTIYDTHGKKPLNNTLVEIWHANEKGEYDNTSPDYNFRAAARTGKDGKYSFKTILPPPYVADLDSFRPAHIHFRISHGSKQDLITQIYFEGDEHLKTDPSTKMPQTMSRILPVRRTADNTHQISFDVTLRETYTLEPAAFKKLSGIYFLGKEMGNAEFYQEDDLLVMKLNGQLLEAFTYKGNNEFEGGLGFTKLKFEFPSVDQVKVTLTRSRRENVVHEGTKILQYSR